MVIDSRGDNRAVDAVRAAQEAEQQRTQPRAEPPAPVASVEKHHDQERAESMAVRLDGDLVPGEYLGVFPVHGAPNGSTIADLKILHSGAFDVLHKLVAETATLKANPRLTEMARREDLESYARAELLPQLERLRESEHGLAKGQKELHDLRSSLSAVEPLEPGDVVGALALQEARAVIRDLPEQQRAAEVLFRVSAEIQRAILLAPPEISSVSTNTYELLEDRLRKQRHGAGAKLDKLRELGECVEATDSALQRAYEVVVERCGIRRGERKGSK